MNRSKTSLAASLLGAAPTAALVAVGALTLSAPTHADAQGQDWKGYAGVNCVGQSHNTTLRRSGVSTPALSNTGTSTVHVFCPVVRDEWAGGDNRVSAVAMRVRNRNSLLPLTCEFSSHNINGVKIAKKTAVAPAGSGELTLQLGPMNAHNWGSYMLQCSLPGRDPVTGLQSYIINYRVDEKIAP